MGIAGDFTDLLAHSKNQQRRIEELEDLSDLLALSDKALQHVLAHSEKRQRRIEELEDELEATQQASIDKSFIISNLLRHTYY